MQRITFERVRTRARYPHFIETCGATFALHSLHELAEARVGSVFGNEFPTEEQRLASTFLAHMATGYDPTVEVLFNKGTSHFPGAMPTGHPMADLIAE